MQKIVHINYGIKQFLVLRELLTSSKCSGYTMYTSTDVVDFEDVARRRRDAIEWDAIVLVSSG